MWREIQALRASPTGLAATETRRRQTFSAALRQAEELAQAADAVSYAVKALPLFYSLSQAGRAIAAAHLQDKFELQGHGIQFKLGVAKNVLAGTVGPQSITAGAFQRVASATGSATIDSTVDLGALWAANPDLVTVPIPAHFGAWRRALGHVIGTRPTQNRTLQHGTGGMVATTVDLPGETGGDVANAIAHYPSLAGARGLKFGLHGDTYAEPDEKVGRRDDGRITVSRPADPFMSLERYWQQEDTFYSVVEIDDTYPTSPDPYLIGWAIPAVADGPAPSPLLLWWALLFGLSNLTRYHPAAWSNAVDLDSSPLAVLLREALDVAADRVPARVLAALRGYKEGV